MPSSKFTCSVCGYETTRKYNLQQHEASETACQKRLKRKQSNTNPSNNNITHHINNNIHNTPPIDKHMARMNAHMARMNDNTHSTHSTHSKTEHFTININDNVIDSTNLNPNQQHANALSLIISQEAAKLAQNYDDPQHVDSVMKSLQSQIRSLMQLIN